MEDDWLERAARLRRWTRDGLRAPHKPLLLLYALARYQREPDAALPYTAVERDLARLLEDFGPPRRTSPAYPFHHLAADGVWEVRTRDGGGSPGALTGALRDSGAAGRLAPQLRGALERDPALLGQMSRVLLDVNFPESLHAGICSAVGLELEAAETAAVRPAGGTGTRRRDPAVRLRVLVAYEYRCAFCAFDGMLDTGPVGLEAAHVRWWAYGGPDDVANGLCLCSLHHKLFDLGVLGLDREHRVLVSQRFTGRSEAAVRQVLDLAGRPVTGPQRGSPPVAPEHIAWHTSQVFRGRPRVAA